LYSSKVASEISRKWKKRRKSIISQALVITYQQSNYIGSSIPKSEEAFEKDIDDNASEESHEEEFEDSDEEFTGSNSAVVKRGHKASSLAQKPKRTMKSQTVAQENLSVQIVPVIPPNIDVENVSEASIVAIYEDALAFLSDIDSQNVFAVPVPETVKGYYKEIKAPMDLSNIHLKVNAGSYRNFDEFCQDVDLMLDNCLTFNSSGFFNEVRFIIYRYLV